MILANDLCQPSVLGVGLMRVARDGGGEGVFIFGQAAPVTHKNHDFFRKSKKNKNLL